MFKDLKSNACYDNADLYKLVSFSIRNMKDEDIDEYLKRVRTQNEYDVVGYYENEKLVGLMIYKYEINKAFIEVISVEKDERGKGIGETLLNETHKRTNCESIEATCESVATSFYKKLGFEIESLEKNYYNEVYYKCTKYFSKG